MSEKFEPSRQLEPTEVKDYWPNLSTHRLLKNYYFYHRSNAYRFLNGEKPAWPVSVKMARLSLLARGVKIPDE